MITMAEKALSVALNAHQDQVDKGGQPYIWHPIRVALNFDSAVFRAVALLHDVLEDTDITEDELRDAFGDNVADAVVALTRTPGQGYGAFIEQCAKNPLAKAVKIADLEDNMTVARLPQPLTDADRKRLKKYKWAHAVLKDEVQCN